MPHPPATWASAPNTPSSIISVLVIGAGVGCLVGLSVSPVVSIVVASVIGVAGTVVAALAGVEQRPMVIDDSDKTEDSASKAEKATGHTDPPQNLNGERRVVNTVPLAVLVVGIVIGALLGIYGRNQGLLGSTLSIEVSEWVSQGIEKDEVARRLFEARYPTQTLTTCEDGPFTLPPASTSNTESHIVLGTWAFAVVSSECPALRGLQGEDLHRELESSNTVQFRNLAQIITDTAILESLVKDVVCFNGE